MVKSEQHNMLLEGRCNPMQRLMKNLHAIICFVIALFLAGAVHAGTAYTVKRGDTLTGISRKYNVSVSSIKRSNNLKSNRLSAGIKLVIPDDLKNRNKPKLKAGQKLLAKKPESKIYIVKKGDNLYRIAKRFKVSADEIKRINKLKGASLKTGQKLYLAKKSEDHMEKPPEPLIKAPGDNEKPAAAKEKLEEVKLMSKADEILTELSVKERLILFAKKMIHFPYKFGGNGTFGLDCSGYVQKAYSFVGLDIPRSAREQFTMGESVNKENLSTGDLVFFRTYASFPSHVGIYLGNNLFIHASALSKKVTIDSLESPYYFKRYIGAKRLIPEDAE